MLAAFAAARQDRVRRARDKQSDREKLHRLVDELADAELAPTLRIVEMQRHDAVLHAFANAPEDDEPWTAEDEAAVVESDAEFAAGNTLSHEEMLRKYG